MAAPQLFKSRIDPLLSNLLLSYTNEQNFIGDKVFSPCMVPTESGKIGYLDNTHLRGGNSKRGVFDLTPHRMEHSVGNDKTFAIDYYDKEMLLPYRLEQQSQAPFNQKKIAAFRLMESAMLENEITVANTMTSTSVLTQNTTLTGTARFDQFDTSTPEDVIETGRQTVLSKTGVLPNSVIIPYGVLSVMKRHPFFLSQNRALNRLSDEVVIATIKEFFGLTNVYVAKAINVSSAQGQSTETMSYVWGKDMVLFYQNGSAESDAQLLAPSFGYVFKLQGQDMYVDTRLEPTIQKGELVRINWARQYKVLDAQLGYLVKSVIN